MDRTAAAQRLSRLPAVAAGLLFFTLACGSHPAAPVAPADAGSDAGMNDAGTSDAGTSDAGGSCLPGALYGGGETASVGGSVTATIVDTTGAAAAGQPIYICGIDLCSAPANVDSQGHAAISTGLSMKKPAFRFGDAVNYAEFSIPLTASPTAFGTLTTGHLPATGAALTPGTTATSGDVSLAIPAGAMVAIDTIVYGTAAQQALRTVAIPVASAAAQLASAKVNGSSANFQLLYGLAPVDTTICPPAKVTVPLPHHTAAPNDLGWAAGAAVEFWVTTTDVGQTFAPYSGWARLSDGVVSADGASVSTVEGQGFPFLESFAVRLK